MELPKHMSLGTCDSLRPGLGLKPHAKCTLKTLA